MKVGIDLGTTNSAVAWIDPAEAAEADFPPIHTLDILQPVADGRAEARKTLPSFEYLAEPAVIGHWAREQGALVPTKLIHSAKSWLSNAEVDRTEKILPWDAQTAGRVLSPVEASAHYLATMAAAWQAKHGTRLADQDVVLTVPASFDEEARELTVQAARDAGLEKLTLIEEPAAAFYAWIANHLAQSQKQLTDGMQVLICDVGGGTSDFTLIRVDREGDRVQFTRTAVGKHLLLGGDNLDLTLSWLVEAKLGTQLSIRQRSALRRQCSAAKERLLSEPNLSTVDITVAGAGTGLVGGTLRTQLLRDEVLQVALDGFLPGCELADRPKDDKKSLFRELGLPYVSDPAITKHLAEFLAASGGIKPDAVLFNGGFFIPDLLRKRVVDVLEYWFGHRPLTFSANQLDLAVAIGAAYYSYVRSTGAGLVVRGGLPRSYFLQIGGSDGTAVDTVCLMPRGTEDGAELALPRADLELVANRPVRFQLFSSLTRVDDQLGDAVRFAGEELAALHRHAPLEALIRFGKKAEERGVPVKLGSRLTEVGTLEIFADSQVSEHRWRLQFELRKKAAEPLPQTQAPLMQAGGPRAATVISEESRAAAEQLVAQVFSGKGALTPEELPAKLEQALALGRNSWPVETLRALADRMLEHSAGRKLTAAMEIRWLNLCGFCLRPGFGYPGDELRIEQARRVYMQGLEFSNQIQNEVEWWILMGRLAGGFNRNQQADIYQRISARLLPKGKPQRINSSLQRELWRTASSLELLPVGIKTELGDALVKKVKANEAGASEFWCLSRLGARDLFYGPANLVVPAAAAARWVDACLRHDGTAEALVSMARHTGDAARDLPPAVVDAVRKRLAGQDRLLASLDGGERNLDSLGKVYGEALPSGLVFAKDAAASQG